ncbi:MAG: outer membrane PBP1 activator LpoA protein [Alcanivorax sp.]|jgi:outer membrane PBP1 activator LpoA protein
MTAIRPKNIQHLNTAVVLSIVLLSGCAGTPEQTSHTSSGSPVDQKIIDHSPNELPASVLADQFAATEASLAQYNWMAAQLNIDQISEEVPLSAEDAFYRQHLNSRIAWQRGDTLLAKNLAADASQTASSVTLNNKVNAFRRTLLEGTGEYLASAKLGGKLVQTAQTPDDALALKRSIWTNLMRAPKPELARAANSEAGSLWKSWLQLAQLAQSGATDSQEREELRHWLAANPDHPAAQPLPGGLNNWLNTETALNRVALILPLSGRLAPAAKAVRDGYLASHYAAQSRGEATPELQIVDSTLYSSTGAAYDFAVNSGAKLVLGPLTKQAVAEIGSKPNRVVPVLALNRAEQPIQYQEVPMVQFSLAPEDEAKRLAELAYGRGDRRALVLHPQGQWGSKIAYALSTQWRQLGGTIAATAVYAKQADYSGQVESALGLSESDQRAKEMRTMLGTNIEFTARRRDDIDSIFLLARNGAQARSIKPLFAYHYASKLPVYSTSSIYAGLADPRDIDLDDILLVDIPWLLGSNPTLRLAIAAGDTGSDAYTRLNALGADAQRLQSRFSQFDAGEDALLTGDTGLLSLDSEGRIQRETRLATFARGKLQPQ